MKIIIVGCGKIGTTIISSLVNEGHDVTAIDENPAVIAEISDIYDVMCVCGNGADCDTLNEAQVETAELFVAVAGSDELNMLSCFLAKRMGANHTIARIRNPDYNDKELGFMRQQLDITVSINPELLAAQELFNILQLPSAVNIETFSNRNFEMVEILLKPDSPLNGISLIDLRKKYQAKFLITTVQRGDDVSIPDGSFVLKGGDKVGLSASRNEIEKLLRLIGNHKKSARSIMILGASRTAYYLAKLLIADGTSVKIIDKDPARCELFGKLLPNAVIILGDGADQDILLEEGLGSMDAFVALTGMDEENILISFFAKSQNVPTVISKVNRSELAAMAEKLGLDCIVSPKKIISDILSRYARALQNSLGSNVETLYKIMDGKAEALEFNVQSDFKYLNVPLKDMQLKPNVLIAGILRSRKALIPSGDDMILQGDKVVVIAGGHRLNDLSDIIA